MTNKKGFTIYLTFLVATTVFMLVIGTYETGRITLDISRSNALETLAFHSADGGLERAIGKLRSNFEPFELQYVSQLSEHRKISVSVFATLEKDSINITSTAIVFEGEKKVALRTLKRIGLKNAVGRESIGNFMEA